LCCRCSDIELLPGVIFKFVFRARLVSDALQVLVLPLVQRLSHAADNNITSELLHM
jgi:hypothetical protein